MPVSVSNNIHLEKKQSEQRQWLNELELASQLSQTQLDELTALCTLSDFAARIIGQYPESISVVFQCIDALQRSQDETQLQQHFVADITSQLADCDCEPTAMAALRKARHFWLIAITYCDFILQQSIQQSLRQVSILAESLINAAYE